MLVHNRDDLITFAAVPGRRGNFCERYGININDSANREIVNKALIKLRLRRNNEDGKYKATDDAAFEQMVDTVAADDLFDWGLIV